MPIHLRVMLVTSHKIAPYCLSSFDLRLACQSVNGININITMYARFKEKSKPS